MHWINCLSWEPSSSKQTKTGLVPESAWKPPSFILQTRRGASHDHALVLCSLLMGSSVDSYVCKGTMYAKMPASEGHAAEVQLVEHVWVMTREDGWVTFYEPTNGKMYHLPKRYTVADQKVEVDTKKKKKKKKTADAEEIEEEAEDAPPELLYEGEAPDAQIGQEDIDALPTTKRQPKAKSKVGTKRQAELDSSQAKKDKTIRERENLAIAPYKDLLLKDSTLVNYLPYDSIDVIFNCKNVWANRQNHNPALIKYDLPDDEDADDPFLALWSPLITPTDRQVMGDDNIDINPLGDPTVSLSRPLDADAALDLRHDITAELEENLRLYRSKLGYDCIFDKSDYVLDEMGDFLRIQELCATLDPDSISANKGQSTAVLKAELKEYTEKLLHNKPYNRHGSCFMESKLVRYKKYRTAMEKRYKQLEKMIETFREHKEEFPVKRNKEFNGFTIHFCTSDVEEMRDYLMQEPKYTNLINVKTDDVTYAIQCVVFPLSARVQSIWVFIGAQLAREEKEPEFKET